MNRTVVDEITNYIRAHSTEYYPEIESEYVDIQSVNVVENENSTLCRLTLKSNNFSRRLIIKVPSLREASYRLTEQIGPEKKSKLQYDALVEIQKYFEAQQDPRFGVIVPLDFMAKHFAIVMEESSDPSLRDLVAKTTRLHFKSNSDILEVAFRNVGSWLSAFHDFLPPNTTPQNGRRTDFIQSIEKYCDYLKRETKLETFLIHINACAAATANNLLPESLPLGLCHGDYAIRNLLVGPNGTVTGLDTKITLRTPIYENISYFLVTLRAMWPQVLSQGLLFSRDRIRGFERKFLEGYFENSNSPIPYEEINLFTIKAFLDKWATSTSRMKKSVKGWNSGLKVAKQALTNRFYQRQLEKLLLSQSVTV